MNIALSNDTLASRLAESREQILPMVVEAVGLIGRYRGQLAEYERSLPADLGNETLEWAAREIGIEATNAALAELQDAVNATFTGF